MSAYENCVYETEDIEFNRKIMTIKEFKELKKKFSEIKEKELENYYSRAAQENSNIWIMGSMNNPA